MSNRVLIVDPHAQDVRFLESCLSAFEVTCVHDGREAIQFLEEHDPNLLICGYRLGDFSSKEFLEHCQETRPDMQRVLWGAFDDLPEVISSGTGKLASRVIPRPIKPETAQGVVAGLLGLTEAEPATTLNLTATQTQILELGKDLLTWSAMEMVSIHGSVVRPPPPEKDMLQLQFVLPDGKQFEKFRESLPAKWHWPLKPHGQKPDSKCRKHPVAKSLGKLRPKQELFVKKLSEAGDYCYLLILPWQREGRNTVILGFFHEGPMTPPFKHVLEMVHVDCLTSVSQFFYSIEEQLKTSPDDPAYIFEYDWVVSGKYVGPDRRDKATSFLNFYAVFGKRIAVPEKLKALSGLFVDQMAPWIKKCFLAYMVLSFMDTALTYIFVGSGQFEEMNPLLRPLVSQHPWIFIFVKNAVSLSTFFVVTRFQLFRIGQFFVWLNLLGYLGLDIYWAVLLTSVHFG